MKPTKRRVLSLAASLALLSTLAAPALAAEGPGIRVQLDGKEITFTEAAPQVKDSRTFLPFKAVFEAMGAEVSNEGSVITAVRGGKTITMTLGSTQATVKQGSAVQQLTMDVAPYVDNSTWRTYVPVRFAAQALGCAVGWDQDDQTVVIVDTEKLVQDTLDAHSFTYLEKLAGYAGKYETGSWAMDGTMKTDASLFKAPIFTATGSLNGVTSGTSAAQVAMDLNMDMTGLYDLMAAMGQDMTGASRSDLDIDMGMDARMDLDKGAYYCQIDNEAFAEASGLPAGTWISMDINAILKQAGLNMDLKSLMQTAKGIDIASLAPVFLSVIPVNDSATAYASLSAAADSMASLLDDDAFQKVSGGYQAVAEVDQGGVTFSATLTLSTNVKGDVTGYDTTFSFNADLDALAASSPNLAKGLQELNAYGLKLDTIEMEMQSGVSDKNGMTAKLSMEAGDLLSMNMDMSVKYTPTTKKPVTTPPAGANVVDWSELMK